MILLLHREWTKIDFSEQPFKVMKIVAMKLVMAKAF